MSLEENSKNNFFPFSLIINDLDDDDYVKSYLEVAENSSGDFEQEQKKQRNKT